MSKRLSQDDLNLLTSKRGYAIQSSLGKGSLGKGSLGSQIDGKGKAADVEQHSGPEPLGPQRVTLRYSGQVLVRIRFFRKRLADPDGNSPKYFIDCLHYSGLLEDDSERDITFVTEPQQKVEKDEDERVEIVLEYPEVDLDNLFEEHK